MTNVTPINRHQRAIADGRAGGQMTSAHRCVIARIQDLAIDVSLQTGQAVEVDYAGPTHELSVCLMTYEAIERGHFSVHWSKRVYLPPGPCVEHDSLQQLGKIIVHLESLLPTSGGAA